MDDNLHRLHEQIINLNNSNEFKQLSRYYKKKSFFNILGISRKENIHSYFLHWLLSPTESHELNDFALRRLLELLVLVKNKLQAENEQLQFPEGIEDIIVCGGYTLEHIICEREHATSANDRLDLFLSFDFSSEQVIKTINIILENKVKSKEGKEQTNRYYTYGENLDGESVYLFLSPISNSDFEMLASPTCDCKQFIGLNYQYLVDYVLEPCLSECTPQDARVFIEEYLRTLSQPSLQFDDFDGGEVIMAVSSRERELLLNFWGNNKDLLTAALNALADNPELEQEERDRIHESLQAVSKASNRDYTKYKFNGQVYIKNRLVLAVIQSYVASNPSISMEDLLQAFHHPTLNIIAPLSKAEEIYERTKHKRHFINEPIALSGCEIAVSTQWDAGSIDVFIDMAKRLGFSIEQLNQTGEIKAIIRSMLDEAKTKGAEYLDIVAGDIIRENVEGNYQKTAMVCSAMKACKLDDDEVLQSPPSGLGSRLTIRYYLH
ncbi:MAG: PD-(D/E)XK nuclease family protein [Oscillospiraceae bacterium]|nr:PD-(D/E)XK nuclease family protein [Oscillospiraceae bacterium]